MENFISDKQLIHNTLDIMTTNLNKKDKRKLKKPPVLKGYLYPDQEARKARDEGKLLSLRIETSTICNLRCLYCYNESGEPLKNEMSYEEIKNIVKQAKELGAKSIVIIGGGEPTVYPKFRELVDYIDSLNMIPVIITNGQIIDKKLAQFLYDKNASVEVKLDSLNEEVQDFLAGKKGAYKNIQRSLKNLLNLDFQEKECRLGGSFVTSRLNSIEVPDLWRFCRDRNIFPNMETLSPNGRAKKHRYLLMPPKKFQEIKDRLLKIDETEYGYTWNPYTPLVGAGCRQLEYSLNVTSKGYVRPCAAIIINDINVRPNHPNGMTLKEVLKHPFVDRARNAEKYLTGRCAKCEYKTNECIGCRGSAYIYGRQKGLSRLDAIVSEDPFCTKKIEEDKD